MHNHWDSFSSKWKAVLFINSERWGDMLQQFFKPQLELIVNSRLIVAARWYTVKGNYNWVPVSVATRLTLPHMKSYPQTPIPLDAGQQNWKMHPISFPSLSGDTSIGILRRVRSKRTRCRQTPSHCEHCYKWDGKSEVYNHRPRTVVAQGSRRAKSPDFN